MSIDVSVLEQTLNLIGWELDYPGGVDLVPAVSARLVRGAKRRPVFRHPRLRLPALTPPAVLRPAWQAAVAAVVGLALILSGVLIASPGARDAVAGWFGLRGVHIVVTPRPPTPPPQRPLGQGLDLGQQTTLSEAQQHLGTRILLPAGLGSPDAVYVHDITVSGLEAFLVYRPGPSLPATGATGLGMLLSEVTGDISRPGLAKFTYGARVEQVRVNGSVGYWIEGGHGVAYLDKGGEMIGDSLRLAGNVLLWERGGLTLRIESDLSKSDAVRLAETIR